MYCTKTTEFGSVVLGCKAALLEVRTTPVGSRAASASPGVRLAAAGRSRTALSDAMNALLESRIALVDPRTAPAGSRTTLVGSRTALLGSRTMAVDPKNKVFSFERSVCCRCRLFPMGTSNRDPSRESFL